MANTNDRDLINNLIGEAISNVKSRRHQVIDSDIEVSSLSDLDAAKLSGGTISEPKKKGHNGSTMGFVPS